MKHKSISNANQMNMRQKMKLTVNMHEDGERISTPCRISKLIGVGLLKCKDDGTDTDSIVDCGRL